jgi:hypothetical protein
MNPDRRFAAAARLWPLFALVGSALIALAGYTGAVAGLRERPELRLPTALVSSPDGRLFVFVAFSRIVSFDADGRLLRSWPVRTGGGLARLRAAPGHLEVAPVRTDQRLLYSYDGELIGSQEDAAAYEELEDSTRATLPGGAVALLRGDALVREDPDGRERVLVPPRPWPLAGTPLPASLVGLAAVPGTLLLFLAWALRRQDRAGRPLGRGCATEPTAGGPA